MACALGSSTARRISAPQMHNQAADPDPPTRASSAVMQDWVRALAAMQRQSEDPTRILASIVADAALTQGDRPALIGTDEHFTYADLAAQANRYARWALAHDMQPGDCVALLMRNRPDYIAIWLGLTQIGCVVALLNTNLAAEGLAHCLRSAAAKHVIAEPGLVGTADASGWWWHGEHDGGQRRIDQGRRAV